MAQSFETFVEVRLGYKSFLNDFFYVTSDVVDRFGIEKRFLEPILMLAHLNPGSYFQTPEPKRWLFHCKEEPGDLRGTGAYEYIKSSARRETTPRKQGQKPELFSKVENLQRQKHWYWPPAPMHLTKFAIRKGIDVRYSPFLFRQPVLLDQRLYLVSPKEDVDDEILAAYLASSLFPLCLETNADLGLGAGVLTLGTDSLRALPTPDLAMISRSSNAKKIIAAARSLYKKPCVDAAEFKSHKEQRTLDELLLDAVGLHPARAEELEVAVARLAELRIGKKKNRETTRRESSKADVTSVSHAVAVSLKGWLDARRFPEDHFNTACGIEFRCQTGPVTVHVDLFFDKAQLKIMDSQGVMVGNIRTNLASAEVIVRSLQMGRRHFNYPTDSKESQKVLDVFSAMVKEFEERLGIELSTISLGLKYGPIVRSQILAETVMPLDELNKPILHGELHIG